MVSLICRDTFIFGKSEGISLSQLDAELNRRFRFLKNKVVHKSVTLSFTMLQTQTSRTKRSSKITIAGIEVWVTIERKIESGYDMVSYTVKII